MPTEPAPESTQRPSNFIQQIIEEDLRTGATNGKVITRFPPEPNGYLHLGHAMAVCLQFGLAKDYRGRCHLRFDDTNPETEDMEYVEAAQRDIRWLGFDWGDHLYFASDYFEALYDMAERLVRDGKAYVDSLNEEQIREYRGTVTEAGRPSPHRDRTVDENLDLLRRMRAGEFAEGAHVLRAKIDMSNANMLLRDPVLYRIKYFEHYRRGKDWCIYPLYDFAHPLSDAIEGITHSLCSLEFDVHRPLYDWLVDALYEAPRPHQYEYARRNFEYTVVSKRKLLRLVKEGLVDGWDDPRMPTIAAQRRRGVPPEAIRRFADQVGIAKGETRIDISLFEHIIRDELNQVAPRIMAVLRPLKVTLVNWPEDRIEWIDAPYWPHDVPKTGSRAVPLGATLYIERDDFAENPPKGFHRLSPGAEVRLRYGYVIRCEAVVKDAAGEIIELRCSIDETTHTGENSGRKGGDSGRKDRDSGRKVRGTIHWVEATHAVPVEVRLYDRLFSVPDPEDVPDDETFLDRLTPNSKEIVSTALAEHSLTTAAPGDRFQFERQGYFIADVVDSKPGAPVFNRTITLRDTWAKVSGAENPVATAAPAPKAERRAAAALAGDVVEAPKSPIPTLGTAQEAEARRLETAYGITFDDAAQLAVDDDLRVFYEAAAASANPRTVANWVVHEVQRERKERSLTAMGLTPGSLAALVELVEDGTLSSRLAKDVFAELVVSGGDPRAIVRERGLVQIDDRSVLDTAIRGVFAEFPERVDAYRGGKTGLMGFFLGQVMKATDGKANPQVVRELLETALG